MSTDDSSASIPLALLGFLWACLANAVASSPPQAPEDLAIPQDHRSKVLKVEEQYLCVGRNASGEAFQEAHANLLDAI
ncbi:MAG: hypothetical protein AAF191_17200, partial [Verrucomicrobiota bacterium]